MRVWALLLSDKQHWTVFEQCSDTLDPHFRHPFLSAKRKIDWRGVGSGDVKTMQETVASINVKDSKG